MCVAKCISSMMNWNFHHIRYFDDGIKVNEMIVDESKYSKYCDYQFQRLAEYSKLDPSNLLVQRKDGLFISIQNNGILKKIKNVFLAIFCKYNFCIKDELAYLIGKYPYSYKDFSNKRYLQVTTTWDSEKKINKEKHKLHDVYIEGKQEAQKLYNRLFVSTA